LASLAALAAFAPVLLSGGALAMLPAQIRDGLVALARAEDEDFEALLNSLESPLPLPPVPGFLDLQLDLVSATLDSLTRRRPAGQTLEGLDSQLIERVERMLATDPGSVVEGQTLNHPMVSSREDEALFAEIVERWHFECQDMHSRIEIEMQPSYQRIATLGPRVISIMIRDVVGGRITWTKLLSAFTPSGEVPDYKARTDEEIREMWLAWAKKNGYDLRLLRPEVRDKDWHQIDLPVGS
jgi:hypothetical protein